MSDSLTVTGILCHISDVQKISDTFKKVDIAVEIPDDNYPQFIALQLVNDKCSLLANYKKGSHVVIHYNLQGRKWDSPTGETKYFNTLTAWKIESLGQAPQNDEQNNPGLEEEEAF